MKLSDLTNFPVCVAPMVGLTHVAFRLLLRSYLPATARTLWHTEMISVRWLAKQNVGATPETLRDASEDNLVAQILADEEESLGSAVKTMEKWGAKVFDLNMGCPMGRILHARSGAALMNDPARACEIVRAISDYASLPISAKLRGYPKDQSGKLTEFVQKLVDAGVSWVTLHPRTTEQKRRGIADWQQIRHLKETLGCTTIGNGDVQTSDDAIAMLEQTKCDMVMVGRALTARPWLLWQVGEKLGWAAPPGRENEKAPTTPFEEGLEYCRALLKLIDLLSAYFAPENGLTKFKFFVRTSYPWLEYGHLFYAKTTRAQTYEQAKETVTSFFTQPQRMQQRTRWLS